MIGLERGVHPLISARLDCPHVVSEILPEIRVEDGRLYVRRPAGYLEASHVLYHGIFEDDLETITALAVWRGPCLPHAGGMLRARPRVPALVEALDVTAFPGGPRGYAFGGATIAAPGPRVAKYGQMHCGEGKDLFTGPRRCDTPTLVEPFVEGRAVRIMCIGERTWQIRLEGDDWRKSIHADSAAPEAARADLVDDTRRLMARFNLEIAGVDYMIDRDDRPVLLELNHIPNVDRFDEIRDAYVDYSVAWLGQRGVPTRAG